GAGGAGGAGGGAGWPTCDEAPPATPVKTLHAIWQDDPAQPTEVWVPGVYVTAISHGACSSGTACQVFVQQDLGYADLAAGAQQALKIFISANAASHFTAVQVGDQVDVLAWAWRYNLGGQHELLLQVNTSLP